MDSDSNSNLPNRPLNDDSKKYPKIPFLRKTIFKSRLGLSIAIIASLLFTIGIVYGIRWIVADTCMEKSSALLSIGDRAGAISILKSHIVESPSDYHARLELGRLFEESGNDTVALQVYERIMKDKGGLGGQKRDSSKQSAYLMLALIEIEEIYDKRIGGLDKRMDSAFKASNASIASSTADTICQLLKQKYSFGSAYRMAPDSIQRTMIDFEHGKYYSAKALADYMLGDVGCADNLAMDCDVAVVLALSKSGNAPGPIAESSFWSQLAWRVEANARAVFSAEKYQEARDLYLYAKSTRQKSSSPVIAAWIAEDEFQIALCEALLNNYKTAVKILTEIQSKYPSFDTARLNPVLELAKRSVTTKVIQSRLANDFDAIDKRRKRASDAFEKKNWLSAASLYYETAQLCVNKPDLHDYAAECIFNRAMAYNNAGEWKKARDVLVTLKTSHPTYDPILVQDEIDRLEKLIQ